MTEEILIDGVNVAGCEHFCHNVCTEKGFCDDASCKLFENCLYKQLKRLEQENKALKKQIESDKGLITVGGKQQYKYLQEIDKLQQENKKLKEENKQHIKEKQILNERLYCYAYEKDCHLTCKQQDCLLKNSYVYRSTLEEINKIAEPRFVNGLNEEADLCNLAMDRIQDKINEVLNENKSN